MCREKMNDASDKLNVINEKMEFIANMVKYVNLEVFYFSKEDLMGLGKILNHLQNEIKEVKELLD